METAALEAKRNEIITRLEERINAGCDERRAIQEFKAKIRESYTNTNHYGVVFLAGTGSNKTAEKFQRNWEETHRMLTEIEEREINLVKLAVDALVPLL